jgi:hypothetical protein
MRLLKTYKKELILLVPIILIGQVIFALYSNDFMTPHYEGRIYATTGVKHKQEDLHKLNEAAHYFGQTMIGWLKFPNFFTDLQNQIELPPNSSISAHIQERQNIIFVLTSAAPVELKTLVQVKDYIQSKIDQYNSVSQTEFVLTNLDYELVEIRRSYQFGALVTLIVTLLIGLAALFIRSNQSRRGY